MLSFYRIGISMRHGKSTITHVAFIYEYHIQMGAHEH